MDIATVMQAVADRIDTIPNLRVHAYPPNSIAAPAAIVDYPDITFDATYGRGMDRMELPVVLAVGKNSDRASRDRIAQWANGSGATSIKAVLESGTYTAFDTIRVTSVLFDIVTIAGVQYAAATFMLDITGQGA